MHCYDAAAQYYQVPAIILKAIHRVEGGKRGDRIADANGTFDHGFMQINTCWKPLLHQEGWTMRFITQNDCANIFAAAWILRQHWNQTHNLWLSVADYHSENAAYGYPYAQKVYQQALSIAQKKVGPAQFSGHKEILPTVPLKKNVLAPQNVRFFP
ncbi:lytic transglycosylase domain-containing protein [Acidithiobacillus thiooxidans]|uniref:lytic transglycosylase domain-containing protein n=1 Tax=Acidithiobacillus thiooxidans TaxID=930 RepID=UPI002866CB0E|nr:lytic transglycosylase domain-containing protein [Acidithiobacillus thiooxidans]MDR7926418.1 lytic transglycosylase domain-containing protein [Acidithiobacillus thiooxidans]